MYLRAQTHPVMAVQQQGAQIELFLAGHPDRRKTFLHQQLQNQFGIASIMFLLAGFRRTNFRGIPIETVYSARREADLVMAITRPVRY